MPDASGQLIDGLADSGLEQSQMQIQAAINAVLDSIPEGESSGVCATCGHKIERARLDLLPGTNQCAACAHKYAEITGSPSPN